MIPQEPTSATSHSRSDPGFAPGDRLRHYVIERELGRGGMGVVYAARDLRLDRQVVIKTLPLLSTDRNDLSRFRREAKLLASVNHPNVAMVHGMEEIPGGGQAIVLEFVEGETLAARLLRGRLEPGEAITIASQIARAIHAAHSRNVIHRDLKPGNVMIARDRVVKVLDFGIARRTQGSTTTVMVRPEWGQDGETHGPLPTGGVSGTPGYMSPEQILLQPEDQRTDVFAFGCVLFECLTGARAFAGSPADQVRKALSTDPDWDRWPADAPDEIRRLVARCLLRDPHERLSDFGEIAGTLDRASEPPPVAHDLPGFPRGATRFIGRSREFKDIVRHLARSRLVTLTGPGGCGKTRLAVETAGRVADGYSARVWFVDLASIADADRVPRATLTSVGSREEPGSEPTATLVRHLGEEPGLLVLDNCEHVLDACAALAVEILRACPRVSLLATSREALSIPGEQEFAVPPLSLPGGSAVPLEAIGSSESVQLFADRAALAHRGFALNGDNAGPVAELCIRLDGIPLAIELAAARSKVMSPSQILDRLDDRLRLLTTDSRAAVPRHRTMRAAIEWSYDHLVEPEREAFRALSVFVGGWALEAAEAVIAAGGDDFAALDDLTRLVNKSMVQVERDEKGESHYRMLESIRQFAADELRASGEEDRIRARHLEYYLALAERARPHLQGRDQVAWFRRLDLELGNFLAALDWCEQEKGRAEPCLRIVGDLERFWIRRGHLRLGRDVLRRALDRAGPEAPLAIRARATYALAAVGRLLNDPESIPLLRESLSNYRSLGDRHGIARALNGLGVTAIEVNLEEAQSYLEEALHVFREIGDSLGQGLVLGNLVHIPIRRGDWARGREMAAESLGFYRLVGDRGGESILVTLIAYCDVHLEHYEDARIHLTRAFSMIGEVQDRRSGASALHVAGNLLAGEGRYQPAVRVLGACDALRESIGSGVSKWDEEDQDRILKRCRERLGPSFETSWAEGRSLSFEEAIREAREAIQSPV